MTGVAGVTGVVGVAGQGWCELWANNGSTRSTRSKRDEMRATKKEAAHLCKRSPT